jgi:branched-chain amino acid transport system ATP-binding protein
LAELVVKDVSVRFGGVQALSDVSLEVHSGMLTGLIGPNGAGKTTLFNVITGLQSPTKGTVLVDGRDITRLRPHRRSHLGLARTFQRLELFGTLSARENVQTALEIYSGGRFRPKRYSRDPGLPPTGSSDSSGTPDKAQSLRSAEEAERLLQRVGAFHVADEPADVLPTGLARLVELARALATNPSVLLLDEPSAGLGDAETAALGTVLQQVAAAGVAVLLVEHDMSLVMNVCHQVAVLDYGVLIAKGEPSQIQRDPSVQAAYLGTTGKGTEVELDGSDTVVASHAAGAPNVEVSSDGIPPVPNHDPERREPEREEGVGSPDGDRPAATASPMFELVDMHAGYGRIEVVHGVSLSIPRGSVLALLGPNGGGKSTLLKVASGQLGPTSGRMLLEGKEISGRSAENLVRMGLCAIPEGRSVFPNLTVAENLQMYSYCRKGLRPKELLEQSYERFPVLKKRNRQLAGTLSGGEQQSLSLARALCSGAKMLLIDEMSMGLAPIVVAELYERVKNLVKEEQVAVLLVEQFAEMAITLADEAAIMVNGRIVRRGSPSEMEPQLARIYMGDTEAETEPRRPRVYPA